MNVVEFILSIKDGASHPLGSLTKAALGSKYSLDDLTKANEKLRGVTDKTGNSIGSVRDKIRKLQEMKEFLPVGASKQIRQVNEEIEKLEKGLSKLDGKKPEGGGFKSFLTGLAVPALAIGGGIVASINQGMKNSKSKLDFEILVGKDSGDQLYAGLKKMKGLLGDGVFELGKELADSMDSSKIIPTLQRLGDVSRGDQGKLAGLSSAFSQLTKDGKLSDSTLSALEQNGFKPLVAISETTGESLTKVRQRFAEGKISAGELEKALKASTDQGGRFHGVMQQLANSPSGKWNEFLEKISLATEWLGDKLLPVAMEVIDYFTVGFEAIREPLGVFVGWLADAYKWIKNNKDVLEPLVTVLGGFAIGIYSVIAAKAAWIAITTGLTTSITAMSAAIMAIPVIGWILAAIAAIIAAVVYLRNNFEGFGVFFKNLWEQMKASFSIFVTSIKQGFEYVTYGMQMAWLKIKSFGQYIAGVFANIGNALKLAAQFKFGEAKAALTATITTEASKEIEDLDKSHKEKQDGYEKEKLDAFKQILLHPLEGIIKRKSEEKDSLAASEDATGGKNNQGIVDPQKRDLKGNNVKDNINAISGGGVKNIIVTVAKLNCDNHYHVQGNKQIAYDIGREVEEQITRAIASASAK